MKQNFTQFAIANGFPSDYDVLDHGDLGTSGHVSNRQRLAAQQRHLDRARNNRIAHAEYNKAIIAGTVEDPSSDITKASLLNQERQAINSTTRSKIDNLYHQIGAIEGLGKMSHLANGKLKVGYQRTVDIYQAEIGALS